MSKSILIPHSNSTNGFSLIEVLVSILILSFGILGATKMQLYAMQMSQQSNFYSTAAELASDLAERLRGNQDRLLESIDVDSSKNRPPSANCFATQCSAEQLAQADIFEWFQQINSALPNARAVVCRDNAPWNASTKSLNWDCSATANASVVIKLGWSEKNNTDTNSPPRFALAVAPYLN